MFGCGSSPGYPPVDGRSFAGPGGPGSQLLTHHLIIVVDIITQTMKRYEQQVDMLVAGVGVGQND